MNQPKAYRQKSRPFLYIPLASTALFLLAAGLIATPCTAAVVNGVTFAWSPNPPTDAIDGYRLFFGPESRFTSSGALKAGFQYSSSIDFATSMLCTGPYYSQCEYLGSDRLQCHDLYNNPSCSVAVPPGTNYFTLQAYNSWEESDYSLELRYPASTPPPPSSTTTRSIVPTIAPLLLNKRD